MEDLTIRDLEYLLWYRSLDPIERSAVDDWLTTGDPKRLVILRKFSKRLQRFHYMTIPHSRNQFTLDWC